jgi:HEAT repeat protein
MKRITLAVILFSAAGAAGAQTPPVPRTRPTPPAPAATPAPAPRAPTARSLPRAPRAVDAELELERTARAADAMRWDFQYDVAPLVRIDAARIADEARAAVANLDVEGIRRSALESSRAAVASLDIERIRRSALESSRAALDAERSLRDGLIWGGGDRVFDARPPASWAQGDPADSLWRIARDVLNRGEFSRAAQMFSDLWQRYPKSVYAAESAYYEAYARYRIGTTDQLKLAAKALETLNAKAAEMPRPRRQNAGAENLALAARIDGELARRGDREASERVKQQGSQAGGPSCDKEDLNVRIEALSALNQLDPVAALPVFRKVVERRDDCFVTLRQRAVFMLGRRGDNEATVILTGVAKSDPSVSVRSDALTFLARIPGDASIGAIEEILRSDSDERVQRSAVRALNSSDNPKARQSVRALLERKDVAINLRLEVLNTFNSDRSTEEDAAYLRNYYPKADNDRVKEGIINAIGRVGGNENEQLLISIARNNDEEYQLRASAISRLTRIQTVAITEFVKMYDVADSRYMREQLINVFRNRKEAEASDKLIDIAKTSTDPDIRTTAIRALVQKNDPRTAKLLNDLVNK